MKKVMAFGVFDFLHQGHINFLRQAKRRGTYLVVSVARDANVFEAKGHLPVFREKERLKMVQSLDFVDEAVLGGLDNPWAHIVDHKPAVIALGYDQGPYLASTPKLLEKELEKRGLHTKVARLKKYKDHKTGKLRKISGTVKKNIGRGTKLGFPTANLKLNFEYPEGVYLAFTSGKPSLAFIGSAKTFGENDKKLEVYVLDFNGNLYGKRITVELIRKVRNNKKFNTEKELIIQMKKDEQLARDFFASYTVNTK